MSQIKKNWRKVKYSSTFYRKCKKNRETILNFASDNIIVRPVKEINNFKKHDPQNGFVEQQQNINFTSDVNQQTNPEAFLEEFDFLTKDFGSQQDRT